MPEYQDFPEKQPKQSTTYAFSRLQLLNPACTTKPFCIAAGMMAVTTRIFAFTGEEEIVEAFEKRLQDWVLGKISIRAAVGVTFELKKQSSV